MALKRKHKYHFTFSWLPNTITLFNLFTGFLAILSVCQEKYETAARLIFVCLLWDSLDGNIARAFKNPTSFGRELDSLADMVSFVVAPTLLAVSYWHYRLDFWTLIVTFAYLAAGAYRLGRFNVRPPVKTHFEGFPTPAAAIILATLVLTYQKNSWGDVVFFTFILQFLMILMSFLMASQISYPKLSAMKFSRWRSFFYTESFLFIAVFFIMNLETALVSIFLLFLFLSPAYCLPSHSTSQETEEELMTKAVK